jgi:hypothetical protein
VQDIQRFDGRILKGLHRAIRQAVPVETMLREQQEGTGNGLHVRCRTTIKAEKRITIKITKNKKT